MKKQYATPEMEVYKACPSEIICASVGFGTDGTNIMHSAERGGFFDESDF